MKKTFASLVRDSSAHSFSLRMSGTDAAALAVLGAAAGCAAFFLGAETKLLWRSLVALQAAVGVCACYEIVRSLVPMALSLSFADMMRMRTAYYAWAASLVGMIALGPVARAVFSSFSAVSASLALTFASVALTTCFLQRGSLAALALASACAGLAFGVSVFGIVAAAVALAVLKVVAIRLFCDDGSPWQDALRPAVVDYFVNPLVRSRANWVLSLCFFGCAALSFFAARTDLVPAVAARMRIPWSYGVSLDGAAFVLATGILPFAVSVGKARRASDTFERLGTGKTLAYLAVAAFSAVMLVNPALPLVLSGLPLRIETSMIVFATVIYAYNLLLSVTCILIDVRCRSYWDTSRTNVASLRWVTRMLYALACLAPLALLALVVAGIVLRP